MSNTDPIEPRLRHYLDEHADDRAPVGFEDRILRLVTNEPSRPRSTPRQIMAATAIAALAVGLAAGVAYLRGHGTANQGPGPSPQTTALSIGTQGGGDWVVARSVDIGPSFPPKKTGNILYKTADGGASWQARLNFTGIYDGMSWTTDGRTGVLWTFEMTTPCGPAAQSCNLPPARVVTVYSTTDGGFHWTQHSPKTFGNFALIYFRGTEGWVLSEQDIVAQGQPASPGAGLYRTTDGGATWTHVSDLTGLTGMQLSGGIWGHTSGVGETNFEFADAQHGWLATGLEQTASPSLLETTDGGKSWHGVTIVEAPAAVAGQQVVLGYPVLLGGGHALLPAFYGHRTDPNNFSITHRYIYSSNDGGSTWSGPPVELKAGNVQPTGDEWQNFYLDANHWWFTATNQRSSGEPVAQAGPAVARTTDGGKSWQLFSGKDAPIILQMTFTDANNGWAFAIAGPSDTTNILLRTTDGGAHWHQVQVP